MIVQRTTPSIVSDTSQILMIIVTMLLLIKTFFFLRIFKSLSFLVTMVKQVIYDLKVFMLFFILLIFMFAIVMSILDIQQYKYSDNKGIRDILLLPSFSGQEYLKINRFIANMIFVYRISLGDYDFGASTVLDDLQNGIYWFFWALIVTVTCIVFLNFIIAEVGASYSNVKQNVEVFVL